MYINLTTELERVIKGELVKEEREIKLGRKVGAKIKAAPRSKFVL